jgi:hypothetical protein
VCIRLILACRSLGSDFAARILVESAGFYWQHVDLATSFDKRAVGAQYVSGRRRDLRRGCARLDKIWKRNLETLCNVGRKRNLCWGRFFSLGRNLRTKSGG